MAPSTYTSASNKSHTLYDRGSRVGATSCPQIMSSRHVAQRWVKPASDVHAGPRSWHCRTLCRWGRRVMLPIGQSVEGGSAPRSVRRRNRLRVPPLAQPIDGGTSCRRSSRPPGAIGRTRHRLAMRVVDYTIDDGREHRPSSPLLRIDTGSWGRSSALSPCRRARDPRRAVRSRTATQV